MLYESIESEFLPIFNSLEKKRKRTIILNALGWVFFMLFVLFITFFIVYNIISGGNSTIWIDAINWITSRLPKGFPPHIIIFGGILLLLFSSRILLKKSINNDSLFSLKTKTISKNIATKVLPTFAFNRTIKVKTDEVLESLLFSYAKSKSQIIISDTLSKEYENTIIKVCNLEVYGSLTKKGTSFLMTLPYFNQLILTIKLLKSLSGKRSMTEHLKNESFKGVYITADFNKRLNGSTLIYPDNLEKYLGHNALAIQKIFAKHGELVRLEDPEFEKEFVVFSSDQVEARYALSTSMMEKLTLLKRSIDKPIMVSFVQNKINIAIINPHGFFGVDKSKKLDGELLKSIYQQLIYSTSIVEELKLNQKLWS